MLGDKNVLRVFDGMVWLDKAEPFRMHADGSGDQLPGGSSDGVGFVFVFNDSFVDEVLQNHPAKGEEFRGYTEFLKEVLFRERLVFLASDVFKNNLSEGVVARVISIH
jgi:hypothetical protein